MTDNFQIGQLVKVRRPTPEWAGNDYYNVQMKEWFEEYKYRVGLVINTQENNVRENILVLWGSEHCFWCTPEELAKATEK